MSATTHSEQELHNADAGSVTSSSSSSWLDPKQVIDDVVDGVSRPLLLPILLFAVFIIVVPLVLLTRAGKRAPVPVPMPMPVSFVQSVPMASYAPMPSPVPMQQMPQFVPAAPAPVPEVPAASASAPASLKQLAETMQMQMQGGMWRGGLASPVPQPYMPTPAPTLFM